MKLSKLFKNLLPVRRSKSLPLKARYDAAQTVNSNAAHWEMATPYDADREASPQVRQTLRSRSRYETGNNSWLKGMVRTISNDVVGTGPRLQLTGQISVGLARRVEKDFHAWAKKSNLARKLRCARRARTRDGEAFILLINNPLLGHRVKLDLLLIEADRVTDTSLGFSSDYSRNVDGIVFDAYNNPVSYEILKSHPGGEINLAYESVTVPAQFVIHLFDLDRPEQHRGVSELTAALPDCAILRRYTRAMVKKMETSANLSGVIESDAPADSDEVVDENGNIVEDAPEPFKNFELPADSFAALPRGWKINGHSLNNPTDSQSSFATQVKADAGFGCLSMPRNVALGDSSSYNYASGRLDNQAYGRSLSIENQELEIDCLDVIFEMWLTEYLLQAPVTGTEDFEHCWYWDGREHVDPSKEASATDTALNNNTTTLAEVYGKQGKDWQTELEQRIYEERIEREMRIAAGLPAEKPQQISKSISEQQPPEPGEEQ